MRGADVGTALMAVLFSFDLSWLSPLFIFVGVVLFISRQSTAVGRIGRVLIGLGLMLLALRLVVDGHRAVCSVRRAVRALLASLTSDVLLEITIGAVLAVVAYSSLAVVLLVGGAGELRAWCRSTWRWAWCSAPTWAAACWRC